MNSFSALLRSLRTGSISANVFRVTRSLRSYASTLPLARTSFGNLIVGNSTRAANDFSTMYLAKASGLNANRVDALVDPN